MKKGLAGGGRRQHRAFGELRAASGDAYPARVSCVLRAYGSEFDVDRYLAQVELTELLIIVRRKGLRRYERQENPDTISGFNLTVSEAEFTDLDGQQADALAFLKKYERELELLAAFPGVQDVVLDFGIEDRDVAAQADYFSPELLGRMGRLNIGLVVSRYPRDEPPTETGDLIPSEDRDRSP